MALAIVKKKGYTTYTISCDCGNNGFYTTDTGYYCNKCTKIYSNKEMDKMKLKIKKKYE